MRIQEKYILSNGVKIPQMGLGTWFINNGNARTAVREAIETGYRHIDTAQAYRNEAGVGQGIRNSGLRREEVFITTKLAAGAKSYKKAVAGVDKSLKTLGVDYIDLMIIHSPQPWTKFRGKNRFFEENIKVWRALEEAYKSRKVRAIGLSNFEEEDVDNTLRSCFIKPMVNQVLAHVGNVPFELIRHCKKNDILVQAYSPVAHGQLLKNEKLVGLANKYGVSVPQLSIRYLLQQGLLPLPKTANPKHMKSNAEVDFEIESEDMDTLHGIEPVTDYGSAGVMPVFGGKLNLGGIFKMILNSIRGKA